MTHCLGNQSVFSYPLPRTGLAAFTTSGSPLWYLYTSRLRISRILGMVIPHVMFRYSARELCHNWSPSPCGRLSHPQTTTAPPPLYSHLRRRLSHPQLRTAVWVPWFTVCYDDGGGCQPITLPTSSVGRHRDMKLSGHTCLAKYTAGKPQFSGGFSAMRNS